MTPRRRPDHATMPEDGGAGPARVLPQYGGASLLNIPPTICRALGVSPDGLAAPLAPAVLPPAMLAGVRAVLLLVVDGLGAWQLDAATRSGDAPTLARLVEPAGAATPGVSRSEITSVLPSSTVPALATLGTGLSPAAHGLMGWTVYLEEFGEAVELARFGPAAGAGSYQDEALGRHDPVRLLRQPTLHERLAAAGVPSVYVGPAAYRGSGLTRLTCRGADFAGYHATSSALVLAERALAGRRPGERLLVYVYWDPLDVVSHHHGPGGAEHAAELATLDFALGRWLDRHEARGDLLVLLTADHGHVPGDPARIVRLNGEPGLLQHLAAPPTGERRLVYLHARPGALAALRAFCGQRLGEAAELLEPAAAFDRGLFGSGPVSAAARRRAGDLILLARGEHQLAYSFVPGRDARLLLGNHGGLDPREMLVPLLALRR